MAEPTRTQPPPTEAAEPKDFGHIPMSEEMDRARWTLPPIHIVVVGLVILAIVAAVGAFLLRSSTGATGGIQQVFAVDTGNNSVLVTVQVSLRNTGNKPLFVKSVNATLAAAGQTLEDDAASFTDWERYFHSFPDLRAHAGEPLKPETRLSPGEQVTGTVIFGFPVTREQFDARQSLSVSVALYDQRPVVFSDRPTK